MLHMIQGVFLTHYRPGNVIPNPVDLTYAVIRIMPNGISPPGMLNWIMIKDDLDGKRVIGIDPECQLLFPRPVTVGCRIYPGELMQIFVQGILVSL